MNALTMRQVRGSGGEIRHVPTPYAPAAPARGRKKRVVPDPIKTTGDAAADQLRQLIERIERVQEEVRAAQDDLKDIYAEAKATGHDVRTIRTVVKLRGMEKHHRDEADELLETYRAALGMI